MPTAYPRSTPPVARVWWREPYVWLVIGGPAVVVVAGIATAIIAMTNPDPVLDRQASRVKTTAPVDTFTHAPAGQARNHATTATVPTKP
jgi:hypothetical protein